MTNPKAEATNQMNKSEGRNNRSQRWRLKKRV